MQKINNVLIVAGTHGNEMSGIEYLKFTKNDPASQDQYAANYASLSIEWTLANSEAIKHRARFVGEDLNRQFTLSNLAEPLGRSQEHNLALAFNSQYGPKGDAKTDLVIDIHNTTSNMGPTLIILENDHFHRQLARFVKQKMPSAVILLEDEKPYLEHQYLCTVGTKGVMIEVGPQPQGVLRPQAYLQTKEMCEAILLFCESYNAQYQDIEQTVDAYKLIEDFKFPTGTDGEIIAMIHPDLQNQDFKALENGMPIFLGFDGVTYYNESDSAVYPHFIGESAYYHLGIAFATASKIEF